ncbi:hypothetical protein O6H91_22G055400 [Diphasiastrum complanatum]|uniref:Uncharacterized protein n=1 Tax=Diphasiastrum complanatum TaxID=34168 RepID=A0ACC2AFZ6_DIPCM|nr:hypothetical protein O6H91_Y126800 [Diphasiastrum complanatum]KAJ7516365.1 hypothetical protein O6H91_22G055400 [Diphasiastrum complanatum]
MGMEVIEESSQEGHRSQQSGSYNAADGSMGGRSAAAHHQSHFGVDVHPTSAYPPYSGSPIYGRPSFSAPTLVELALRLATIVFSIIAFSVIAATSQNGFKFDNYGAFNYLLAINVLAFVYSILQVAHWTYKYGYGKNLLPPWGGACATFVCDQVLAYLLMSASSSGATATVLSQDGLGSAWPAICNGLQNFCTQAEASVSMSFLAFFSIAPSSLLSGYQLLELLRA